MDSSPNVTLTDAYFLALLSYADLYEKSEQNADHIRSQDDVLDGQVAAVVVDDSATLKRVYHLPVGVQLMPLNPAFAPMLFTPENSDSVRILGLAVGYFRKTV